MSPANVRISERTYQSLRTLSDQRAESMQSVLDKAVEAYRRQRFLEELNSAYAALREDAPAWSELQEELAAWEATTGDGLEEGEAWEARPDESPARRSD
jgi:hypothetical protein